MGQAAIPLIMMAVGTGVQMHNTRQTARRQDQQAAESIRGQGRLQRQADAKVNEQVAQLEASRSADERAQRLDQYYDILRSKRGNLESGLAPGIGSEAFRGDSAAAAQGVQDQAQATAGLMARMDAPQIQRQGEATGFGHLATDIGLVGRQSAGQRFIDDLRLRSIRRNPWLDAVGQGLASYGAGSLAGAGQAGVAPGYNDYGAFNPTGGVGLTGNSIIDMTPTIAGGRNTLVYGPYNGLRG